MTDAPKPPAVSSAPQPPTPPPAKRDTTMAWLAHLLLLFTAFIGPLIIWQVKKDEDKYAAYHGKQALCWWVAIAIIMAGVWLITIPIIAIAAPLAILTACFMPLVGLGNLAYVIYAIIQTSQGKPFKYFFVADKFCAKEFAEAYPDLPAGQ